MDLDELWDFSRPAVSEERFRAALTSAPSAPGEDAQVLRTQLARSLGLQCRFDEARAELDAVTPTSARVSVHLHLERGRIANSSGDRDTARPHFLAALDEAEAAGLDHLAADAAHMMAIIESGEAQIPWAERALAIAEASFDPRARRWVGSVTHNLGWTMHDLGRYGEALALFERALAFRLDQGDPELIRVGRWTVARGLRSLGRYDEALAIQRELAHQGPDDGYVAEELGELLLVLGRDAEARPHFARAHELLSQNAWLEPDRLSRLATLGAGG